MPNYQIIPNWSMTTNTMGINGAGIWPGANIGQIRPDLNYYQYGILTPTIQGRNDGGIPEWQNPTGTMIYHDPRTSNQGEQIGMIHNGLPQAEGHNANVMWTTFREDEEPIRKMGSRNTARKKTRSSSANGRKMSEGRKERARSEEHLKGKRGGEKTGRQTKERSNGKPENSKGEKTKMNKEKKRSESSPGGRPDIEGTRKRFKISRPIEGTKERKAKSEATENPPQSQ
jgi:hypothetical protein